MRMWYRIFRFTRARDTAVAQSGTGPDRCASFTSLYLSSISALLAASFTINAAVAQIQYAPEMVARLKQARDAVNVGRHEEARRALTEVLKSVPNCVDAYEILGISYLKEGNCRQAELALSTAHKLEPNNSNILNNLGNALYRQNKLKDSIVVYKKALALQNDEPYKIWANLGNSYGDLGRIDEAQKAFDKAVELKDDFAPAYLGRGRMFFESGKLNLAEKELESAVKYKDDYASAYYYLGRVEAQKNKLEEAASALQKSLTYERNPQYLAETRALLADVQKKLERGTSSPAPAPMIPSLPSMFSPQNNTDVPKSKEAALDKVNDYLLKCRWADAQAQLEHIIADFDQNDPVVWNNLGYARVHQGHNKQAYLEAIKDYRRALQLKKGPFPTAHYNLGQALRLRDAPRYSAEAERSFRQAIEDARTLGTTCPLAQNGLGLVLKQKGDTKGADAAYRRAISQSGTDLPVAHYNLALLLEQSEKTREAVREYKAYLTLEPHGINASKARKRLTRLGIDMPMVPARAGG